MINSFEIRLTESDAGGTRTPKAVMLNGFQDRFLIQPDPHHTQGLKSFHLYLFFREATLIKEEIENFQNKRKLYMRHGFNYTALQLPTF